MQTYLARFNELNSRVNLSGQALKRVITTAITADMYKNIWRKYGCIPDNDADLLSAVREAGIEEEELARAPGRQEDHGKAPERRKDAAPKDGAEACKRQGKGKGPCRKRQEARDQPSRTNIRTRRFCGDHSPKQ